MSKPKVLHVLYSGLGGHGSVVFSLLDADTERKWNSSLLFIGIEELLKAYSDKCNSLEIEYNYFPAKSGRPWTYWLKAYRYFEKNKPDILFLHSALALVPAYVYARRRNKAIVVIEHTPNQVKTSYDWFLSRKAQRWASKIVVLSREYKEELKHKLSHLFKEKKYTLIPNGIDNSKFLPVNKTPTSVSIHIGMAARFSNTKDQGLIIRALESLPAYLQKKVDLSFAGDGEFLETVKELSSSAKVEAKIDFKGNLPERNLISWLQTLDVYVHASKGETMCTAIMQAMACGLPVIASDIPGINNLVNAETGILVAHNVEAFGEAIKYLSDSQNVRQAMGQKARQYAEDHFSYIDMFKKYDQLVNELNRKIQAWKIS